MARGVAPEAPKVAIIGAGIAGSSAAWFLRNQGLNVTVFEGDHVGGRVAELSFPHTDPIMLEAGGAAIHTLNEYMSSFIDLLGLHRDDGTSQLARTASDEGSGVATWDGERLIPFNPLAHAFSLLKAKKLVSEVISSWQQIYGLQAKNVSFATPHDMLRTVGVDGLANISAFEWLRGKLDPAFIREFVDGVSRVNYGQDSSINAFADSVSLAGAGLVGSLFSVKEGNSQVMEGLLRESGAELRLERVATLRRGQIYPYEICLRSGACDTFHFVVVAAPLEFADIAIEDGLVPPFPARAYQTTVATFVAAAGLNHEYFNGPVEADTVMTTSNAAIPFNSVAVHGLAGNNKVYKLFSSTPPSEALLDELFAKRSAETRQFVWHAYPVLRPSDNWPAFRLHHQSTRSSAPGALYYVNAMESPVSCMETEAVAARNVALLLLEDFRAASHGSAVWKSEPRLLQI